MDEMVMECKHEPFTFEGSLYIVNYDDKAWLMYCPGCNEEFMVKRNLIGGNQNGEGKNKRDRDRSRAGNNNEAAGTGKDRGKNRKKDK